MELHAKMRQLTIDAGVSPELYERLLELPEEETSLFLQQIYDTHYKDLVAVWRLHSAERWGYYYRVGAELAETRLLSKARGKLNEAWRKFNKGRVKKRPVQSEPFGTNVSGA